MPDSNKGAMSSLEDPGRMDEEKRRETPSSEPAPDKEESHVYRSGNEGSTRGGAKGGGDDSGARGGIKRD